MLQAVDFDPQQMQSGKAVVAAVVASAAQPAGVSDTGQALAGAEQLVAGTAAVCQGACSTPSTVAAH